MIINVFKIFIIFIFFIILFLKYILYKNFRLIKNLEKKLDYSIEFNKIYSELYYTAKLGKANKPEFNKAHKDKNYLIKNKKGVCLCAIAKNENLYAKEFVEYYRLMMFKKIIIFDNNDIQGEKINDILCDYLKNNFIDIIDIRGLSSVQIGVYNYCYKKYNQFFDWLAFFDFDEYLYIKKNLNIENYLYNLRFKKCESILFNWHIYNDNGLEKYDNRPLNERFKTFKTAAKKAKSIIRGNLSNILFTTVHIGAMNINYFCDSTGKRIFPQNYLDINLKKNCSAYINHFYTKTAEEFCVKLNRGGGQHSKNKTIIPRIKSFFTLNKITSNKIEIIEKCTNLNIRKIIYKHK